MAYPFRRGSHDWDHKINSKIADVLAASRELRRWRRRTDAADTPRVFFESLEQRYLLSADISPLAVAMASAGHHLTVRLDGSTGQVEVVSDQTGQVVGEQQASRTSQVQIIGSGQDDRLTIELTAGFALPFGINFTGVGGTGQLGRPQARLARLVSTSYRDLSMGACHEKASPRRQQRSIEASH
jgi:hypothetical protein